MMFYHKNNNKSSKMFSKLQCLLMLCILVPNTLADIAKLENSSVNNVVIDNAISTGKFKYANFDSMQEGNMDYLSEDFGSIQSYNKAEDENIGSKGASKKVGENGEDDIHDTLSINREEPNSFGNRNNRQKRRHGGRRRRHFDDRASQNGGRAESKNWRDGDFVMTDVLADGEKEKRIRFMGISAKETTAGSNGIGLLLRQLTDGRHFIQVIANLAGKILDCEYVHEKTYIDDFLKQFNEEISTRGESHDNYKSQNKENHEKRKKYGSEYKNSRNNDLEGAKYTFSRMSNDRNGKKILSMNKKMNKKIMDYDMEDYSLNPQYRKNGQIFGTEKTDDFEYKNTDIKKMRQFDEREKHAFETQNGDDLDTHAKLVKEGVNVDDYWSLNNEQYNLHADFENSRDKRSSGNGHGKEMRNFQEEADYYTDLYNSGAWNDFNENFTEESEEDFDSLAKESFKELNSNDNAKKSRLSRQDDDKIDSHIKVPFEIEYKKVAHRMKNFNGPNKIGHNKDSHMKFIHKQRKTKNMETDSKFQTDDHINAPSIVGYGDEFVERTYSGFQDHPRKSFNGLYNVTIFKLDQKSLLSKDDFDWLDYAELEGKCDAVHAELSRNLGLSDSQESTSSHHGKSRNRRSLRQFAMMPGTLWCGAGQLANANSQLGELQDTDVCCRAHDACPGSVPAFQRASGGVINKRPYSLSKCECDRRRRTARSVLVPGTLWCGRGYSASSHAQLGAFSSADRCCRSHDMRCPFWIAATETKYGLFNWRPNTLMHCRCDERFRSCLKLANSDAANMVGQLFFNVVQTKCFVLKPAKVCLERSWWGKCSQVGYTKMAHLRDNLRY